MIIEKKMPLDIKQMCIEYQALQILRDKYIDKRFGLKKSIKCQTKMSSINNTIWRTLDKLYPDIKYTNSKTDLNREMIIYTFDEEVYKANKNAVDKIIEAIKEN